MVWVDIVVCMLIVFVELLIGILMVLFGVLFFIWLLFKIKCSL